MLYVGLAIVVVALLLFLLTRKPKDWPGPGYMGVIYQDEHARETGREWVKIKEPDFYPENGLGHLPPYVEDLFASNAWRATLMIFTLDEERGVLLEKADGGIAIDLDFERKKEADREAQARAYFESIHAATKEDYLTGSGGVTDNIRSISWWVSGDSAAITAICQDVLRDLCNVNDEEGLNITFEEHSKPSP